MPVIDWHSWEKEHQEEVEDLDITTLEKVGRGLFQALLSNIFRNYCFKQRLDWFKNFKSMNKADGDGWGNSTREEAEGKYTLLLHKAILEHRPTQNTEVKQIMGQNLTISSGSHWIEADYASYLTRFKIIFCWLWQQ